MAKTLLQLINEVSKNARLNKTYTAIDADSDADLIVQFINEMKREVEAERQWRRMQKTITFSSVIGTQSYDTSDLAVVTSDPDVTTERSKMITDEGGRVMFFDVSSDNEKRMTQMTRNWVITQQRLDDSSSTDNQPQYFSVFDNGDGLVVEFPFDITAVRDYSFEAYVPQDDLAVASTEIEAPWRPVALGATALFVAERGDELGLPGLDWWERYNSALSEAMVQEMFMGAEGELVAV